MPSLDADVLLLAAGFGTRLKPLTDSTPKPLLEIDGRCLIEFALDLCVRSGARRVLVNLHYLGDRIRQRLGDGSSYGLRIEYAEEPVILDTGGAIKNIEGLLLHDRLIVLNSDTIFGPGLMLDELVEAHLLHSDKPAITAVVRQDPQSADYGELGLDTKNRLVSFLGKQYSTVSAVQKTMFAGAHVLERSVITAMPPRGSIFSVTRDTWAGLLAAGETICGYHFDGYWSDVGTPERFFAASKEVPLIFPR
ncbi:MAG: NTP transferase domain-containing protein [Deltaproteobacteria bacterium]|nr:NTP transferase domain-containing protein [Deltaproteobacteria bacterium]